MSAKEANGRIKINMLLEAPEWRFFNPVLSTRDFRAVPEKFRTLVPEYIKDYVS